MTGPNRVEGYAIVSADGMIADKNAVQIDALRIEADQKFFHAGVARAAAAAHGRHSCEGGPDAASHPRLILTRRVSALARHPSKSNAVLWNPAGASLADAWKELAPPGDVLAVIGGTEVFGLFLERGYDVFYLTRVDHVRLPQGRPVFPGVPDQAPENLLQQHGLKPTTPRVLDAASGATLVAWRR